ncbi:hypothetical protein B5E58_10810 [Tyzzerella sp. An114]|uniref:zinc ribbon domain-containing protein n=1 Tax=Tyzzerella sp. An114 TaxID=1965545 RepID=UPI000B44AB47|nr:zinc ribbon domain-containing protein [Tyzzerella sp. An114]OUQ56330.1 hypothetical protein B5E58_10810 [Tyzzerella sp. An114]HIT72960.1 zinc-ribbon domain-containing protein [Candidatus Fimicola cottocaccae]
MNKFCSKCGKELEADEKFCKNCGTATGNNVFMNENNIFNQVQKPNKKKSGCLIVIIIGFIIAVAIAVSSIGNSNKSGKVDDAFIKSMNTTLGTDCKFTISDHSIYFEESLQEYIGKGSFTTLNTGDLKYTYNFRAYIKDNTINFGKVDVYDPYGNHIVDHWDEEGETEHYNSIEQQ